MHSTASPCTRPIIDERGMPQSGCLMLVTQYLSTCALLTTVATDAAHVPQGHRQCRAARVPPCGPSRGSRSAVPGDEAAVPPGPQDRCKQAQAADSVRLEVERQQVAQGAVNAELSSRCAFRKNQCSDSLGGGVTDEGRCNAPQKGVSALRFAQAVGSLCAACEGICTSPTKLDAMGLIPLVCRR